MANTENLLAKVSFFWSGYTKEKNTFISLLILQAVDQVLNSSRCNITSYVLSLLLG